MVNTHPFITICDVVMTNNRDMLIYNITICTNKLVYNLKTINIFL